jgi:hypothetical protein
MAYHIVKSILSEELDRLRALSDKYRDYVSQYPKGSISYKRRSSGVYAYLAFRQGSRVVFKYVGPEKSDQVLKLKENVRLRQAHQKKLQSIVKDIIKLEKLVKQK